MYSRLRLARKYLNYYLSASNGKGHGTHSPFVFDFITRVLNDARDYPAYTQIEELRRRLLKDNTMLEIEDLGAGSAIGLKSTTHRSIADITRQAAKPRKLGQLLFRIARHYRPRTLLELGTSLGLSAAYLAAGAADENHPNPSGGVGITKLLTLEGAPSLSTAANANFRSLGLQHIEQVTGGFDSTLPGVLSKVGSLDLAFVDGNHRREPTLRYFQMLMSHASPSAVLIFDDIHWSREMEEAWAEIKQDPRVLLTVDLFFIGLVFRNPAFQAKQNFVIRF